MKQKQNHSGSTKVTRRALVGGAAASTVALASGGAAAQRCPATPPVRTKGPAVWLDHDQQDMDEIYDQSVFAFSQRHLLARAAPHKKRETPKTARGDREPEWAFLAQTPHTENQARAAKWRGTVPFRAAFT
jgi:hypothetical protein